MYDYHEFEDSRMKGTLRDWRKALRTPATYRMGNTVRIQPQFVLLITLTGIFLLILFYYNWWASAQGHEAHKWTPQMRPYNTTYPLTAPLMMGDIVTFRIGIVADLDTNSKSNTKPHTYNSFLKRGSLSYNQVKGTVKVMWDAQPAQLLMSTYSHKGRGMELSELIVYDGRMLTFDDRSGMVSGIIYIRMSFYSMKYAISWPACFNFIFLLPHNASYLPTKFHQGRFRGLSVER